MTDISPKTFHSTLYRFYSIMACFGLFTIFMELILWKNHFTVDFIGVPVKNESILVLVALSAACTFFSYVIAKKHSKILKEMQWRKS